MCTPNWFCIRTSMLLCCEHVVCMPELSILNGKILLYHRVSVQEQLACYFTFSNTRISTCHSIKTDRDTLIEQSKLWLIVIIPYS